MIINSLLDTDLYKLTMQQFAFHRYNNHQVEYKLIVRSDVNISHIKNQLQKEVDEFKKLKFNDEELQYLCTLKDKNKPIFKNDYIEFLKIMNLNEVNVNIKNKDQLELRIIGPWHLAILFEVPVMAMIQELLKTNVDYDKAFKKTIDKRKFIEKNNLIVSDFGTRRRHSRMWHKKVVKELMKAPTFVGTSNILIAKELGLNPVGTMAHEFFQFHQGIFPLESSQKEALKAWKEEYGDQLDVALTDIFNSKQFMKDYKDTGVNFSTFRHDSGSPYEFGNLILKVFKNQNKKALFSDGLNLTKALKIRDYFAGKLDSLFGIGTFFTNDFEDSHAVSLVIKMVKCCNKYTIKVSDEPIKVTCESQELINKTLKFLGDLK